VVDLGHVVADELAAHLGKALEGLGVLISTAESCTGGGVSAAITSVPGSSAWFDRGFVVYSNEAKRKMLAVKVTTLKKHGAVSKAVVEEMAKGAIKKSNATFSVAISGLAGPDGGTEEKPVGLVWVAWAVEGQVDATRMVFPGDRAAVRSGAVAMALQGLLVRVIEWKEKNKKNAVDIGEVENLVQ